MKEIKLKKPQLRRSDWVRRSQEFLKRIQADLMPDQADKIVAINMETGEYVLGDDSYEAVEAYRKRWPDVLAHVVRVDGGPAGRKTWP